MTDTAWPDQPELRPEDDNWHEFSAHWWETETNWWSFNVPERKLGGWLYTQSLGVQQTVNGGAWVWDDSDAGAVYERKQRGLPFPDRGDLRDVSFPNGVSVKMLEPLMRYRTTYSDPGRFECDLVHEGIIRPHSHPIGAWPFWATRHFDQPMHVTGTILLYGEEIPIDCYSVRDRSWGPRPAGRPKRRQDNGEGGSAGRKPAGQRSASGSFGGVGYSFCAAGPGEAWLTYAI